MFLFMFFCCLFSIFSSSSLQQFSFRPQISSVNSIPAITPKVTLFWISVQCTTNVSLEQMDKMESFQSLFMLLACGGVCVCVREREKKEKQRECQKRQRKALALLREDLCGLNTQNGTKQIVLSLFNRGLLSLKGYILHNLEFFLVLQCFVTLGDHFPSTHQFYLVCFCTCLCQ